ncbi:NTPase [Bradyrhizobium ottawaense]|uniref:KAP family P-loop NTPase fold protein n=1 Tax=Bradyrhizobium TaxID=374 RepID=UPI0012605948|nr:MULTISPECIES: P-loop NTPase fold protein [Bradyrhizobium]MBR0862901.1 hypothetical protein [Bradyrhizobium diazoefficiens]MBR0887464.1 hypothetical protein [Bradyrhizobium diazoefficiens]MBR0919287.1 hypothetical protein [Bradyrhizobium diazoefficiens]BBO06577.1 NTPase [Bradyrhizobium ottawaense]
MSGHDILKPGDDAPKNNPWQEDRLGFKPFTERLARVILSLEAPTGYVVGLHGEWGSGKSTAINFVKAFLEKSNAEIDDDAKRIEVLEFRPWIVSGHQDLITAFFKVLSEKLPGARRSGWLERQLRWMRGASDPVLDAVATVAVVIDPSGGVASKTAAKLAGTTLNSAIDHFLKEPSLQAAYDKLHALLQAKQKRFLVIIDDLDRLRKDEIRSIMQMVKTVGRLPNVIYFLSYDREIVWDALDEGIAAERRGPNFGEKIVQQEIELPRPFQDDLLQLLDSEVAFLTASTPQSSRWMFMVRDGVRRWMRQPRDVQRLANAVKFSWPALKGEIDPQDLLIMEGLRLFDERVFDWIRWSRDWLFGEGRFLMADDEIRKGALAPFLDQISTESREQVLQLLGALFPSRAKLFGPTVATHEYYPEVVRRRGIGCQAGYDAYFTLYPSPNEVPAQALDLLMQGLHDRAFVVETIEIYIGKKDRSQLTMVGRLLQELSVRFSGRNPSTPTQSLLDALFDVGEKILQIDWQPGQFRASPQSCWAGLVSDVLLAWGTVEAGVHLERSFREAKSISLCASVFVARARELGKISGGAGDRARITEETLVSLGAILLTKLRKGAESGALLSAPRPWDVVRAWKYLGDASEVRVWLNSGISDSAPFMSAITEAFVSYVIGSEPRQYSMSELPDAEVYDLKGMSDAARKHLQGHGLGEDARNRIGVVADAIERHLASTGKSDKGENDESLRL